MSLTRNDIQILKEVFQPQFDRIDLQFDKIDKRFDEIIVYMNKRFNENEKDHDRIITQLIGDLYTIYTPREDFKNLEKRLTKVENKLQPQSS